jgi:valyl-tRNA synthetase
MAEAGSFLMRLAWASSVSLMEAGEAAPAGTVSCVCDAAEVYIPLGDLVDIDKEIARLTKEADGTAREIERAEAKLADPGFTGKAPAQLVAKEREKLEANRLKLQNLGARIEELGRMKA